MKCSHQSDSNPQLLQLGPGPVKCKFKHWCREAGTCWHILLFAVCRLYLVASSGCVSRGTDQDSLLHGTDSNRRMSFSVRAMTTGLYCCRPPSSWTWTEKSGGRVTCQKEVTRSGSLAARETTNYYCYHYDYEFSGSRVNLCWWHMNLNYSLCQSVRDTLN